MLQNSGIKLEIRPCLNNLLWPLLMCHKQVCHIQ